MKAFPHRRDNTVSLKPYKIDGVRINARCLREAKEIVKEFKAKEK